MRTDQSPEKKVFRNAREAQEHLLPLRRAGKTLVTTNGCFDILHSGHVCYLAEASMLGDLLVVGVNADATVRKLKGPGRPLRGQDDRALTMAALAVVDAAFVFTEDDPRAFLDTLKPDVHVKGGDYRSDIIERETVERNGGRIAILSYVNGFSTTSIVNRIRNAESGKKQG